MAKCLVLKTEDICDNNCVRSKLIYYYQHYALLNEEFFRESEPRTVAASLDACRDLAVLPGIYDLIFTQEKGGQPDLASIKFVKPVDMWETKEAENEQATHRCSCS